MSLYSPANRFSISCNKSTVSFVGVIGQGYTWMILESSKNQYPTLLKLSLVIQNLNTAPKYSSMRLFNRGVLTIYHISGAAPFPWPILWNIVFIFRTHISPLYLSLESPKAVLTK